MELTASPFEVVKEHKRTILRLHGTANIPVEIDDNGVGTILNALADGLDLDLKYTTILGPLDLSPFSKRFERTEDGNLCVAGNVQIWNSEFRGPVSLCGASFSGNLYVFSTRFVCNTSFSGASFRGNVDFRDSVFYGDIGFRDVLFCRDAYFWGTAFNGEAQFAGAFSERPASFADVKFRENTVLAGLWNHIFRPVLSFPARLIALDLPERKVTTFFGLNTTIIDGASNPYLKRYKSDEQWVRSWRRRGKFRHLLFLFWELTSHCGRSFGLWVFWVLASATAFGAIYSDITAPVWLPHAVEGVLARMDPVFAVFPEGRPQTPFTPYYFSIVTFTTLGFGDIQPMNLAGEIWLVLEVLLGYIMLGGLVGIFANKFARRS